MDYLTDKDCNEIAQKAYKLDPKENSSKEQLYKCNLIEVGNRQFQVIDDAA
ncbi:hypothetical protein [Streptococcus sinensis]|uniref:hypothetical protein n=1 Tax=Streptococcus sinensis TaxID=176090 RepID=UPI00272CDC30|nr:hypothetical protein [Streptococcus sinensis]